MESLLDILKEKVNTSGNRVAVVFKKNKWTYKDLWRDIGLWGTSFYQQLKLQKRDKVGILLKNCPEYIVAYFGTVYVGGIVVPLNTFLTAEELTYIIHDAQIRMLVTSEEFLPQVKEIQKKVGGSLTVVLTDAQHEQMLNWHDVLKTANKPLPYPSIAGNELAVILYTSGTTGHPKGAMLSHRNIVADVMSCTKAVKIFARDRIILFLPLFHSFTFTVCVLIPFYHGARIYVVESIRPFSRILKSLLLDRITIFVAIPIIYKLLLKARMSSVLFWFLPLRICVSGGSALEPQIQASFERKFQVPLLEGYGLSEAAPVVTISPEAEVRRPGSVGLPLPDIEVKLVDEEGKEIGVNEVGEIIVRGPNVMMGYYNAPELTAETLRDGWLYTGDMARMNQDGYIYIVDRKKDMIIYHGMNIYPREIEEILLTYPSIAEAAVVGQKNTHRGEVPVAFIVPKENTTPNVKEILAYCRSRLAAYKIPRQFRIVNSLPKTATGKISKKDLRKML